jgi:LDH2 family malate/lactate/ureidoglycolate dehydrogenase
MPIKKCLIGFSALERFMANALTAAGVSEPDAAICADVISAADKFGIDSHGVSRFKSIYMDRIRSGQIDPKGKSEIVREGPATAVMDGRNGMGQVVSKRAMQTAIDKAKQLGMGMVSVRNSNHYGIAGYYVRMAAEAGMIGITGTNARPSVAPIFGVEPMFGTNPLAFGLPTDESFPFILDCATSAAQRGKIELRARQGKDIPKGWVIGSDGKARTDSAVILHDLITGEASLLPLGGSEEETGGHKGYGYAVTVEILSSALAGGAFLQNLNGIGADGKKIPFGFGHFFIAMDVSAFADLGRFKKSAGDILRALRGSRKAPGKKRIYTAGEKETIAWTERAGRGVELDEALQKELLEIKNYYHLNEFHFPFE